ncbi:hypothetical protein PS9374_04644 [Planomonospora sphaerica]|uniref:Uncharacterized protein n=1 Tax=Planomonospora sphaerica TaxID=161355 RepID=A0A171DJG8_9ACTN|nr:hypothetical protein [Planomonospora sphaerica]GAT68979.1 hypothetical protein PS9374_04644 [Planomonospora sphaerica]
MTGTDRAAEPATDANAVVVSAVRREGRWITPADDHGIVVHGRTLRGLQTSAQQALTLQLGALEVPPVQVRPQSAALDELATARLRYNAALCHAVQTLRADGASWTDIAQACKTRIADVQAALDNL